MSFVMGAEATQRVKFLDQDGQETLEDDDPYLFLRYEAAGAPPKRKRRKPASVAAGALPPFPACVCCLQRASGANRRSSLLVRCLPLLPPFAVCLCCLPLQCAFAASLCSLPLLPRKRKRRSSAFVAAAVVPP